MKRSCHMWGIIGAVTGILVAQAVDGSRLMGDDGNASSEKPAQLKRRFLAEYSDAYHRLSAPLGNITVKGRETGRDVRLTAAEMSELSADAPIRWSHAVDRARLYREVDFVRYIRGDSRLLEKSPASKKDRDAVPEREVCCYSPSYTFRLWRPNGSDAYQILLYSNEESVMERHGGITDALILSGLGAAYRVNGARMCSLPNHSDCLTFSSPSADGTVRVDFHGLPRKLFYESGWVVLNPGLDWAITEYSVVDRNPGAICTITGKVTYGEWGEPPFAFPKKVEKEFVFVRNDGGVYLKRETLEIREIQRNNVGPEQFTLPAFGLPDLPVSAASHNAFLIVDSPSHNLGTIASGDSTNIRYLLHNQSSTTIRLVGANQSCDLNGCNEVLGLPLDIPADSEVAIEVEFHAPQSGTFCKTFRVFTDRPSQPSVRLEIQGTVELD